MTQAKTKFFRGYLYIATATLFWAVSATVGRAVFTGRLRLGGVAFGSIDPLILSQSRATFSFLALAVFLLLSRGWRRLRLSGADLGLLLAIGILGVASSNYLYYLAIQRTNVATAIVVQNTAPIWVLLYMVVRGLQKATVARVAAVLLAVIGVALAIGLFRRGGLRLDSIGVIAALLAAFSVAFYNIAGHRMLGRYDHWMVLLYTTLGASLVWIVLNPPWKIVAARYSGHEWVFLALFAIFSLLLPYLLYFPGLRFLGPTRAIVTSGLEPAFSVIIAAIVLGEVLRPLQSLGIVLVLAAIVVVQLPDRKSREPVVAIEPLQ